MQQTCSKLEELAKHKILVLDLAYQPIAVINWEKAMYLWLSDKADVLNFYENLDVNSPNDKFQLPAVLRVRWLGKKRQKQHVHFSRWSVLARDNFMCAYCGNHFPEDKLTLDHVVPFSHGGERSWDNIISACFSCNHRKANRTPEQAGMRLLLKPYAPKWNEWFLLQVNKSKVVEAWKDWLPDSV